MQLRHLPYLLTLLAIFWTGSTFRSRVEMITYAFGPDSHLYLEGQTNVNEFSCTATQDLPPQQALIEPVAGGYRVETTLKLAVQHLDCGHRIMNRDMWEALEATKHPFIFIQVKEVSPWHSSNFLKDNAWAPAWVTTQIRIAGQERSQKVAVEIRKIEPGKYQLRGQLRLRLTDFQITPPKAMLGMVAVRDEIVIHYELVVLPQ